ncbi:MAG: DUF3806 domain-containing protein, partial [Phycisphaerae bacterium]|nr:DUF3806 domain-containing protein [Phycisphaerae bacterium]
MPHAPGQKFHELSEPEQTWLAQHRDLLVELLQVIEPSGDQDEEVTLPEAADLVIERWRDEDEETRLDPNEIVHMAGVAVGDSLAQILGEPYDLRWMIVEDADGMDLCLHSESKGLTLYPSHTIAKHSHTARKGLVSELFLGLLTRLEEFDGS